MLNIPKQYASLEFVKPLTWKDIFDKWRELEAWQKSWKKHLENRGFSSWDEWREAYAAPISSKNLAWFLYEIKNPLADSPLFYGTPTRSWIDKVYEGEITKQLKDVLYHPTILNNAKIKEIKNNFPAETMLTGIVWENKIILIEGMHRACALADWDPKYPLNSNLTIALALWKETDIPVLGGNFKNNNQL